VAILHCELTELLNNRRAKTVMSNKEHASLQWTDFDHQPFISHLWWLSLDHILTNQHSTTYMVISQWYILTNVPQRVARNTDTAEHTVDLWRQNIRYLLFTDGIIFIAWWETWDRHQLLFNCNSIITYTRVAWTSVRCSTQSKNRLRFYVSLNTK